MAILVTPSRSASNLGGVMAGQYADWWKKKGRATNPSPQPSTNIAIVPESLTVTHSNNGGEFYVFTAEIQGAMANNPRVTTYTDSTVSEHCFMDIVDFTKYKPYKGNGKTATKGEQFTILGTGKVIKWAVYDKCIITLSFESAYHCPDLSHNLISIGHLNKAGCFGMFGGGGVTFLNSSENPFLHGKGIGTMYKIELFPPTGNVKVISTPNSVVNTIAAACEARATVMAFATHSLSKPTDADTWHQRLGHPSYNIVKRMHKKGIVKELEITTLTCQPGLCKDCIMEKQTCHPFDGNSHSAKEVLEQVHLTFGGCPILH